MDSCLLGEAVVAQHLGECHVGQRVTRLGGGGEHETAAVVEGVGLFEGGDGLVAERNAVFGSGFWAFAADAPLAYVVVDLAPAGAAGFAAAVGWVPLGRAGFCG